MSDLYWPLPQWLNEDEGAASADMSVQDFLSYRISILSRQLNRDALERFSTQLNVSIAEARVLSRLHEFGPLSFSDLCKCLEIDGALISRAAASLVSRSFCTRQTDAKDGRKSLFALTPEGGKMARDVLAIGRRRQMELLSALTPEETRVLYTALSKLMSHVTS